MKKIILLLFSAFFIQKASAQDAPKSTDIPVDLSIGVGTTFSQTIDPTTITSVTILNRLVKDDEKYTISVNKKRMPAPDLPDINKLFGADKSTECDSLLKAKKGLDSEKDEALIPSKIKKVQEEIKKADESKCQNSISGAMVAIASTKQTIVLPYPITIEEGDMLEVIIKRGEKEWKFEFRTEQRQPWKVYFGFTYVPDVLTKFDNYYAKQDTGTTYLITKMNGQNGDANSKNVLRNISPTVMFTYRFYEKEDQAFKFGLTGGFMYNLETLGAMFGPSVVIGDNITLTTGLAFAQKDKLKGQYTEIQRIKENLDFSQLHDQVWTYDLFFSIGFHIPELFKKSGEKETAKSDDK